MSGGRFMVCEEWVWQHTCWWRSKNYRCGLCIEYYFLVIEAFVFYFFHHSLLVCFMFSHAFVVVSMYKQKNTIWTASILVPWWWKRWQMESSQPNFTTICFMKKKIWLNFAHQNDLCTLVIAKNLRFLKWNFYHNGIWIRLQHNQLH